MPSLIRIIIYKFKFPHLKINPSVEIENSGCFHYKSHCAISKHTNIVIHEKGSLSLNNNVYIGRNVEIGSNAITIGFDTSIQDRCILLGTITIGAGSILAPNVFMSSGGHHFEVNPYLPIREQDLIGIKLVPHKPIVIEDDCWIGINSVIMPGVVIGKGSVIGAGSIVTKSVPPYSVSVGAPAKVIRNRLEFSPPRELIPNNETSLPYFYSGFYHQIDNQQRKIYVMDNIFYFALTIYKTDQIYVTFFNHTESEIKIFFEEDEYIIIKGENSILLFLRDKIIKNNLISLHIPKLTIPKYGLEIIKIKIKETEK